MKNPLKKPEKLSYEYLNMFKKLEKLILIFFTFWTKKTEKVGRENANNPPPENTLIAVFPFVQEIKKACIKMMAKISKSSLSGALEVVLTEFNHLYNRMDVYLAEIQAKISVFKKQKESALKNVLNHFTEKAEKLKIRIDNKTTHLKTLVVDFKKMKRVSIFWPCFFTILLNLLFTIGDTAYVAKAFALVGLGFTEQYLIAVIVGLATGIVGAGVVESLRSNWKLIRKIIVSVVLIGFVVGLYIFIGQLRVELVSRANESGSTFSELSAAGFSLVNIAIFSAIMIIHALAWPQKSKWKSYRDYKDAKKEISTTEKEIKKDEKELENIPDELAEKQKKISAKYDKPISVLEREQQKHIDTLESRQATFNNMLGSLNQFFEEINAFFHETVCLYVGILNKYNHDKNFITMDDSVTDIPNPFSKYEYLDNNLPEVAETEPDQILDIPLNLDDLLNNTNNINNTKNENYEEISIN